jgi:hypothetical protein
MMRIRALVHGGRCIAFKSHRSPKRIIQKGIKSPIDTLN